MNTTPPTAEELATLMQSADTLRSVAEKASRADELERENERLKEVISRQCKVLNDASDASGSPTYASLAGQITRMREDLTGAKVRCANYAANIERLKQERDTARNAVSLHSRNETTYYLELERIFKLLKHGGPVTFGEGHLAALVQERIVLLKHERSVSQKELKFLVDHVEREHVAAWKRIRAVLPAKPLEKASSLVEDVLEHIELLKQERDSWEETAKSFARKEEHYRNLLDETAKHLGIGVHVCDGGAVSEKPHVAKVPELVERMKKRIASLEFDDGKAGLQIQLLSVETANKLLAHDVEQLRRENETLARQVPLFAPSVFDGPEGVEMDALAKVTLAPDQFHAGQTSSVTEFVGQQWCRQSDQSIEHATISQFPSGYLILCNVYRNVSTGALTYEPVAINDLPKLP